MHALLLTLALGQFTVEPAAAGTRFIVVADHHKKHEPAKAACCSGDCCKCAVELATLKAELANLKSTLPPKPYEPKPPAAPSVYRLKAANGWEYTHTDWPTLWNYVQRVNAGAQPRYYYGTSNCASGQCGRR